MTPPPSDDSVSITDSEHSTHEDMYAMLIADMNMYVTVINPPATVRRLLMYLVGRGHTGLVRFPENRGRQSSQMDATGSRDNSSPVRSPDMSIGR